jgi:guanine nucleotide-binding protein G(i) subunit alpha
MGGCLSSPAAEDGKRTVETKQVNNAHATAQPSNLDSLSHKTPQTNGTGESTPVSPNGNAGLSAALMSTDGAAPGDRNRSNAIDRQLEDDSRKFKKECKILLLGESLLYDIG